MARTSKHVRHFLRAASARYEEGNLLREHGYSLAAVYLAGYAVECALKALVLSTTPDREHGETIRSFRGVKAHDYGWLLGLYRERGGPPQPKVITQAVSQLGRLWDTSLRYNPGTEKSGADEVFRAIDQILEWITARV